MRVLIKEGIIVKAYNSFFYVECNNIVYTCKAKGKFKRNELYPCVGDRVIFTTDNNSSIITEISERKNHFIRPLISNIDNLIIISSVKNPEPNFLFIDKLTVLSLVNGIKPIVVFSKSDLDARSAEEYKNIYLKAGVESYGVSIYDPSSIEKIRYSLSGGLNVFSGYSGVGKSSIIHSLFPDVDIETGDISKKLGRGKHTTRKSELYKLGDSYVADTPGFSNLELNYELLEPDQLQLYFPEFSDCLFKCRFLSCNHISEPGCIIKEKVLNEPALQSRYDSYVTLFNEIKSTLSNKY